MVPPYQGWNQVHSIEGRGRSVPAYETQIVYWKGNVLVNQKPWPIMVMLGKVRASYINICRSNEA